MSVDFNGSAVGYMVAGRSEFRFMLPRDRSTLPEKVAVVLGKADAALAAVQDAFKKDGNDRAGHRAANEKLSKAVDDIYDKAAASTRGRREFHLEEYAYAATKLARAMEEAERALQAMTDHAQQAVNPQGVGISADASRGSKTVVGLRFLSDQIASLAAVPVLAEEV